MCYAVRWPQTPTLFRTLFWNFIFKIVGDTNFPKFKNVNFVCRLLPSNFKPQSQCSINQNTMPGPICSANFSRIGVAVPEILKSRLPSFPTRVTLIHKKFNYRKTTEPFSTIFGPHIERGSGHIFVENGVIKCKLRLLEAIQNWYFECMSFNNYLTDLLAIITESVKVYTHCVCEIS